MEPVLTPDQMRRADAAAIEAGTPSVVLMDRAAFACATVALRELRGAYGRRVVVVAGKGNNGGDGIGAARHLAWAGVCSTVLLVEDATGDAAQLLDAARRLPRVTADRWSPVAFERAAAASDLVMDAVLGTGLRGAPSGAALAAVEAIVGCGRRVLSVDIPSGVYGLDGSVAGAAVNADVTVAMQALKVGLVSGPGAERAGRVDVADIGIPVGPAPVQLPGPGDVVSLLPVRPADTHKYRAGTLAVVAGGRGTSGAAALCASGAIAMGAGMVFLGVPSSVLHGVQHVVEAVKLPLDDDDGWIAPGALDTFSDRLARAGALAIGPGIGTGPGSLEAVGRALESPLPLVVDADGITILAGLLEDKPGRLATRSAPTIVTPHAGEFSRLVGDPGADRLEAALAAAARLNAIVHLKGSRAITATPDGRAWINPTGTPALATAGTGDVLTGVIGALLAQGLDAADAAWVGAYVHGVAGRVAAERSGRGVHAAEVPEAIPAAVRRIERTAEPAGMIRTVLRP